jgi:hypothetical protein
LLNKAAEAEGQCSELFFYRRRLTAESGWLCKIKLTNPSEVNHVKRFYWRTGITQGPTDGCPYDGGGIQGKL